MYIYLIITAVLRFSRGFFGDSKSYLSGLKLAMQGKMCLFWAIFWVNEGTLCITLHSLFWVYKVSVHYDTGQAWLIHSHSPARISFEISKNMNQPRILNMK